MDAVIQSGLLGSRLVRSGDVFHDPLSHFMLWHLLDPLGKLLFLECTKLRTSTGFTRRPRESYRWCCTAKPWAAWSAGFWKAQLANQILKTASASPPKYSVGSYHWSSWRCSNGQGSPSHADLLGLTFAPTCGLLCGLGLGLGDAVDSLVWQMIQERFACSSTCRKLT